MTLREAVGRAVAQNPDITLARLDEENARHGVQVAKDPFAPRIIVGSGLAYSNGFPMSIEGSAPSIVQARASQFIFNRQQSYAVAQAKEQVRGAGIDVASKRDEVAYRTASFYLDAERAARVRRAGAQGCGEPANRAGGDSGAGEGRARPAAGGEAGGAPTGAGAATGRSRWTAIRPTRRPSWRSPWGSRRTTACVRWRSSGPRRRCRNRKSTRCRAALDSNKELRKLQSQIAAKGLEMRGEKRGAPAARRPGGAVRPVREIQSLRGLLPQVPAQQRAARSVVPGAGIQRSGREGADVADGDRHHAPEGSAE